MPQGVSFYKQVSKRQIITQGVADRSCYFQNKRVSMANSHQGLKCGSLEDLNKESVQSLTQVLWIFRGTKWISSLKVVPPKCWDYHSFIRKPWSLIKPILVTEWSQADSYFVFSLQLANLRDCFHIFGKYFFKICYGADTTWWLYNDK